MNQEIIAYIKQARAHGISDMEIKKNLTDAGWEAQDVEESFAHARAEQEKSAPNADEDILLKSESKAQSNQTSPVLNEKAGLIASAAKATDLGSGQNFSPAPAYKKPAFYVSLLILLILAVAGFLFYKFVYASPERIWKKFTELRRDKILSSDFNFSYFDAGENAGEDFLGFPLKNIKLDFSGRAYADTQDEENPQSSSEITYSFSSGNTGVTTGFEYRLVGKKFYLNTGDNPYLAAIFASMGGGKAVDWVMLDLEELEKKAVEESSADAQKYKEIFNPQFADEIKKIWEDAIFVKMENYLGREEINGKTTLHFSNNLDKEAVKSTFSAIVDKLIEAIKKTGMEIKDEDAGSVKTAIEAIVEKIQIKEFETWIGMRDFRLYKSKIKTNAPSVVSAVRNTLQVAQGASRDAKRLADVRQMATALELYFNDNGRYPDSKDGQPLEISPMYMGIVPTAPVPSDGNCTDYFNDYWYQASQNGFAYEMTFCLGKNTGRYKSGISKLTPAGITNIEECPSTPENCYKTGQPLSEEEAATAEEQATKDKIREAVDKISFDAEISLEANYSDYGVKKEVAAPEGAFNLLELLNPKIYDPDLLLPSPTAQ